MASSLVLPASVAAAPVTGQGREFLLLKTATDGLKTAEAELRGAVSGGLIGCDPKIGRLGFHIISRRGAIAGTYSEDSARGTAARVAGQREWHVRVGRAPQCTALDEAHGQLQLRAAHRRLLAAVVPGDEGVDRLLHGVRLRRGRSRAVSQYK